MTEEITDRYDVLRYMSEAQRGAFIVMADQVREKGINDIEFYQHQDGTQTVEFTAFGESEHSLQIRYTYVWQEKDDPAWIPQWSLVQQRVMESVDRYGAIDGVSGAVGSCAINLSELNDTLRKASSKTNELRLYIILGLLVGCTVAITMLIN